MKELEINAKGISQTSGMKPRKKRQSSDRETGGKVEDQEE